MDAVRAYLLRVTVAAICCGIIRGFTAKSSAAGPLLKFLCGIVMTVVLLAPLTGFRIDSLGLMWDEMLQRGDMAAFAGQESAKEACGDIIKEKVTAYILDKAEPLGAVLTVEVILDDSMPPVPRSVRVSGRISPYAKTVLTKHIEEDLGIRAEDQTWTS